MVETKHGKYILRKIREDERAKNSAVTTVTLEGSKDWSGIKHRLKWNFISQPVLWEEQPHSHDFDEFLCFFSRDPTNALDFGAEVEVSLGQEGEKQVITSPTVVCIPKGLVHGPINFTKISKTILFCHIYTAPEYIKIPAV